jgi:hypothetical protein
VVDDVAHRLAGGELAVGDVDEVGASEELDEVVPGPDVGGRILGGPVGQPVAERDGPVRRDGEDPHQLQQVRTVVLGMAPGRHRGADPAAPGAGRLGVGAVESQRGGVVVQLGAVDAVGADGGQAECGEQAGPIGQEQLVESAADPVVVQQGRLAGGQADKIRLVAARPRRQPIQRLPPDDKIADEHPNRPGRRQLDSLIGLWQVGGQQPVDTEAPEHRVHHRQATDVAVLDLDGGWVHHHSALRRHTTLLCANILHRNQ